MYCATHKVKEEWIQKKGGWRRVAQLDATAFYSTKVAKGRRAQNKKRVGTQKGTTQNEEVDTKKGRNKKGGKIKTRSIQEGVETKK